MQVAAQAGLALAIMFVVALAVVLAVVLVVVLVAVLALELLLACVTLAPRDEQHLGVRLESHDAVHHLRAHGLQPLGPVDVGLFVEARGELDHRHDFLAAPRRFDQQVHQHRLRARAVDGLLDGQHVGVFDGLAQELQHGLEAVEGVVQKQLALAQTLEDRPATRPLRTGPRRIEWREAQRTGLRLVDELVQSHEIHRPVDLVQRELRQVELLQQELIEILGAAAHHLEPDGAAEVARTQAAAQGLAQVGDLVGVDIELGVARHAKLRERQHGAVGKELAQVRADDAGQQHETLASLAQLVGQADDARQHARHLHDGHRVLTPEGVAPAQARNEIERLVGHRGERMRRIQPHGHEQRAHLLLEEARHPAALCLVALRVVEHDDALALERGHELLVEDAVLLVDELVRGISHRGQVLQRDTAVGAARGFNVVGDAHLEEFVEVGRDDGDVAQALEQRHLLAQRLCQHAPVELQDGALAVEQRDLDVVLFGVAHPGSLCRVCDSFMTRPRHPAPFRITQAHRGKRRRSSSFQNLPVDVLGTASMNS